MEEQNPQPISTPAANPPGQSSSSSKTKNRMYPEIIVANNEHPKRWLAFPVVGYLVKLLLLIPLLFVLLFLELWYGILMLITPFVILFTGKYWDLAYKYTLIYMRMFTKVSQYLFGISDKYPGFSFDENGLFTLKYDKPIKSSRFLAFPVVGYFIRLIILIPYSIYQEILGIGALFAVVFSWFAVLFTGRYPESLFEFVRDYLRVYNASFIYMSYLSDTYPSFKISLNHKAIKILLIILGVIFMFLDYYININNDIQMMQHPHTYNSVVGSDPQGSDQ
jgi:uncharacterized protein DUF4389